MRPELLDQTVIETPREGQPLPVSAPGRAFEPLLIASDPLESSQSAAKHSVARAQTWQRGALVALGMVSLFIVALFGIVTIFSAMSATLLTVDALVVVSLVGLSIVLFVLLERSPRRQA